MELFYVDTCHGCGIRKARDIYDAWERITREVGSDYVNEVREATDEDISWVRGMGGYVPQIAEERR